ncbi:MAG: flavodoxin-dependent (E)-4-hydroxy-3-methylbut-2-enyl-diphosphate synthase [Candidatus Omnitrophica bacterium]|nr:flavodoxin-dependent (E)-4-hydroxy-3-methylbut-2-enyl-diphosphate synthase [Candidatus Omnitrophota bacterium]
MRVLRRKTRVVKVGGILIGGNNPVVIQSMSKTKTSDVEKTVRQIGQLTAAGCEIVRVAVKDSLDARAIKKIKAKIKIPLVADIHFNSRLALEAIDSGADKIRLNPGNIYKKEEVRDVVSAAKSAGIPIRVGVNSGSIRGHQVTKSPSHQSAAQRMVKSALEYIKIIEGFKFYDIVVSLKGSNIFDTMEAYRDIANRCDYPLHLGVTATGAPYQGAIKTSIVLGALLLEGIGDTIRVSLTDKPAQEVFAARAILGSLGLRHFGPEIISCPTCGRCEVDLIKAVKDLESKLSTTGHRLSARPLKLAVMGCVVNGPGEAKEADIGIAFGKKEGLLFKKGKPAGKVPFAGFLDVLLKETERL